jgi:hypothetical protein
VKPLLGYAEVKAPKKPAPKQRRFADLRVPELQAFTRSLPCLCMNVTDCRGPVECAHVRARAAAGPDWDNVVPLCGRHHGDLHRFGRRSWEYRYQRRLAPSARVVTSLFLKAHPEQRKERARMAFAGKLQP